MATMKPALPIALAVLALAPVLFVYACSSDNGPSSGTTPTATVPPRPTQTTPTPEADSGPPDDAGETADSGCTPTTPELDGGGLCGVRPFGSPAAILTLADAGFEVDGGAVIPPGIYDVTSGDRAASVPVNWRETLVLDGTGYTQIRRFDTSNANAGPTNSRSGTYTVANGEITFVSACAKNADAGDIATGSSTFRYGLETKGCAVELRMIVAGTLLTFTRR